MKIIVFDDDPTGSQTVKDCLLLLKWDYDTLSFALKSNYNLFFILTNTRSLEESEVKNRLSEICKNLKNVILKERLNYEQFTFVSRGDSTLRGHNFLEPFIINQLLGPFDATFYIPAFIEAKRITINGNHLVNDVFAHETVFSKDKIFGYETSNLKDLIYLQSKSKINLDHIKNLYTHDLNSLQVSKDNKVYKFIKNLKYNKFIIVDITNYSQLDNFTNVVRSIGVEKKFLFRTAASFISSISKVNQKKVTLLNLLKLRRKDKYNKVMHGLIVVGSYVELTNLQLNELLNYSHFKPIEIDVFNFYNICSSNSFKRNSINLKNKLLELIRDYLSESYTPVLFTSRKILDFNDIKKQVIFQNSLARFISEIVRDIKYEIGYLLSKGGITTNVILQSGLDVNYAYLEGQVETGISLLKLKLNDKNDYLPIVTFPGNIGSKNSLAKISMSLENNEINN